MTERVDAIKTLLEADVTLAGLLPGGIYTRNELGKQGLKKNNPLCADAFAVDDGFSVLQACLVFRLRSDVPDGQRVDAPSQTVSMTGMLEFYFYHESSFTGIGSARDRVYTLLHYKTHANIGFTSLANRRNYFDETLDDAVTYKDDYKLRYINIGG